MPDLTKTERAILNAIAEHGKDTTFAHIRPFVQRAYGLSPQSAVPTQVQVDYAVADLRHYGLIEPDGYVLTKQGKTWTFEGR